MLFEERMYARLRFMEKLSGLSENAFEDFFHDLMSAAHTGYVDIRTHGNIGDRSADGIGLFDGNLYACYSPLTFNVSNIEAKFHSDLNGALQKRNGEFTTFVFVHNDIRGAHPDIGSLLAEAARDHAPLKLDHMGRRRLWQKLFILNKEQVEDILGCEIPINNLVYGIGMEDLKPLLEHLKENSSSIDPLERVETVSELKLDYNELEGDSREALLKAMKGTHLIRDYYRLGIAAYERDEVAAGFSAYYQQVRDLWQDSEDVLWQLMMYVLGNQRPDPKTDRAAWVILAYFFERCDIFENVPPGWMPSTPTGQTK